MREQVYSLPLQPLIVSRESKYCNRLYKYIMMLNGDTADIDHNSDDTDPES
jgi:hypothetical protein